MEYNIEGVDTMKAANEPYATDDKDPMGRDIHEPGAKVDDGKLDYDLIFRGFSRALREVAEVGTFGARKYSRDGWMHVPDGIVRYTNAMYRHMQDDNVHGNGRMTVDADSDCLHAAQVAWNALARLELMLREQEDRDG